MKVTSPDVLRHLITVTILVAGGALLAALSSCSRTPDAAPPVHGAAAAEGADGADRADEGIVLSADEVKAMGIETSTVSASSHVPEAAGYGLVLPHETLAQSVADLTTAMATKHQSELTLERSRKLAGTPGSMSADAQEAAERQAIVDRTALELVKQRAATTWGQDPPWKDKGISAELSAIARGQSKLVRVTFPLSALGEEIPKSLRFARLDSEPGRPGWQSTSVWPAPADASVPGTSFFALLTGNKVHEGERLAAWAPVGPAQSGVLIPAAAVVMSNAKFWFYVESKPHVFRRVELDTTMPTEQGYFVKQGVPAGGRIVTSAAGLLLARETNPSASAE